MMKKRKKGEGANTSKQIEWSDQQKNGWRDRQRESRMAMFRRENACCMRTRFFERGFSS